MIEQFDGKYRYLSNFWLCPVILGKMVYPSTENAYQAAKCACRADRFQFMQCSPSKAKELGQEVTKRADWYEVKLDVMSKLLNQKFKIGTFNALQLEQTGNVGIVEGNNWGDVFWGVCDQVGENHLGIILMQIRAKNRKQDA